MHNNTSYDELVKRIKPSDLQKVSIIPHGNFLELHESTDRDKVAAYFKMINEQEGKPLLNIQTVMFDSTISAAIPVGHPKKRKWILLQ